MTKDIAKSIKAKLLNLAMSEDLNYQLLVIRYLYERLLYRLSRSDYREKFYLKGGALLYALEKEFPRPTLDIDFLGVKIKNDKENLKNIFSEICNTPCNEDGVWFEIESIDTEEITEGRDYRGIQVSVIARLDSIKQVMKMDIGFGDVVMPEPMILSYPTIMEELPAADVIAYSLESVIAEKFQAMIELSEINSRYKDFYDIYKILKNHSLGTDVLTEAIKATFANRETLYFPNHPLFTSEFSTNADRNKQWNNFLKKIKRSNEVEFTSVMILITSRLQPMCKSLAYCIFILLLAFRK